MKTFAILLLTTFAVSNYAHAEISSAAGEDLFAKVQGLYDQGTVPDTTDLQGWTSGRCYSKDDHFTAGNGLLVGFIDTVGADNGPISPPQDVFKFELVYYNDVGNFRGSPANYFDNLAKVNQAAVNNLIASNKDSVQEASIVDGALVTHVNQETWQVRKSQNYLVGRWLHQTEVYQICYYFNKVK